MVGKILKLEFFALRLISIWYQNIFFAFEEKIFLIAVPKMCCKIYLTANKREKAASDHKKEEYKLSYLQSIYRVYKTYSPHLGVILKIALQHWIKMIECVFFDTDQDPLISKRKQISTNWTELIMLQIKNTKT